MVGLEKMVRLADESRFDAIEPFNFKSIDLKKVHALGDATKHDICVSSASTREVSGTDRIGDVTRSGVCHSYSHDGRCVSMLKTLYTNECSHQCTYCSNSSTCKNTKAIYNYEPRELANVLMHLYRCNYVEGLFLSSGIGKDEDKTMECMIEAINILRKDYKFSGYVHLKILPGTQAYLIKQAVELADRVSVNIEVPSSEYMDVMGPSKDFKNDILRKQRYISKLSRTRPLPAGQTTQYVVGGADESDMEIFSSVLKEYCKMGIKRAYYSAFLPVDGTALADRQPQPPWREHRLYQLDWLYRIYKLKIDELYTAFNDSDLLENKDPKIAIASEIFSKPIDPNYASFSELIRVPGIGPISAKRIVSSRKKDKIKSRRELHYLGVRIKRANPYLKIGGWQESSLDRWVRR